MSQPKFYVDESRLKFRTKANWCHCMTDGTEADLIAFALRLGLKAEWVQKPGTVYAHLDLSPMKRGLAIEAGAIVVTSKELVRLCVTPKREANGRDNDKCCPAPVGDG